MTDKLKNKKQLTSPKQIQKYTTKKQPKTHLVVFFKISQIYKTFINPYYDTLENTYEKNAKNTKKTTKKFHDEHRIHNRMHSIVDYSEL